MGTLIGILVERGIPEKWARVLLTALIFVVAIVACLILKAAYDHHVIAVNNQAISAKAAPATDQAATERANDAITINQDEQEMRHVIASQPDQPIAPSSHARACEQLRRAGRNPPACR